MKEICGNCKYRKSMKDGHSNWTICCGNEESDYYYVPVFWDDTCDDFEEE